MRISSLPSLPAPPVWLRLVLQALYPLFGIVMSLLFVVVAVRNALLQRWIPAAVMAAAAAGSWWWYSSTDELPREFIPYFPHIATLLVLVFAAQHLRPPAAVGKTFRREG